MNMKNMTIHPVEHDAGPASYWLDRGDGTLHHLGNFDQVCELRDVLDDLIYQGNHGAELAADDPRIATWLTVAETAKLTCLPPTTIRRACRLGYVSGARPNPWRVTLPAVEAWRAGPKAKRRPTK